MVLGDDEEHLGLTRFTGDQADLKTVCDELRTISMWGSRRLVVIDDADRFVSQNREGLEKYLQKPAKNSVLVLDVKTWPRTTRLAKAIPKIGLELECAPLSGNDLVRWIAETAKNSHGKSISRDAATLIRELAGDDLGLLEQEIAKLSAYVGDRTVIEIADVQMLVGGWAIETTWSIAAAVRRGETGEAARLAESNSRRGRIAAQILGGLTFVFSTVGRGGRVGWAGDAARSGPRRGRRLLPRGQRVGRVFARWVARSAPHFGAIARGRWRSRAR